jgi:hypothetical protein
MEKTSFLGQSFRWRSNHLAMQNYVKSILKVSKEEKNDPKQPKFLESFTKIEEGERRLEKEKPLEWMNGEINIKEFNLSNDDQTKMSRVGDY